MLAAQLGNLAAGQRADLLFGAPRYEAGRTYNSVRLITADGQKAGHYDKQHLVLFAETNPLLSAASTAPSENPRQFSPGTGSGVLQSFVPLGITICHEILFPELVGRAIRGGAELLVNVSNDGWLDAGHGIASRQHWAMAAFRAVESRRYLVRAATTGVSGVIDPYGGVVASLVPGAEGVVTASVAGRSAITPYVRLGDAFGFACLFLAAAQLFRRRHAASPNRQPVLAPAIPA
jgi:apolipoprotein N-acyltransferase